MPYSDELQKLELTLQSSKEAAFRASIVNNEKLMAKNQQKRKNEMELRAQEAQIRNLKASIDSLTKKLTKANSESESNPRKLFSHNDEGDKQQMFCYED